MTDPQTDPFGQRVQALALNFTYPITPNLASKVAARLGQPAVRDPRPRRLALVGLALALAGFVVLAVPEVRATLADFIQIGAVRILLIAPTATPTATPLPSGTPAPTPQPLPTLLPSLLQLVGKTTLDEARQQTGYSIPLPTYPADLGKPDYVFVQYFDKPMVILVWVDPTSPTRVRLSLHIIGPDSYAIGKIQPTLIQSTTVNGLPAIWAEGPYVVQTTGNDYDVRRLIDGHVLIWTDPARLTYRLETDQSMDEAIQIAESLK